MYCQCFCVFVCNLLLLFVCFFHELYILKHRATDVKRTVDPPRVHGERSMSPLTAPVEMAQVRNTNNVDSVVQSLAMNAAVVVTRQTVQMISSDLEPFRSNQQIEGLRWRRQNLRSNTRIEYPTRRMIHFAVTFFNSQTSYLTVCLRASTDINYYCIMLITLYGSLHWTSHYQFCFLL